MIITKYRYMGDDGLIKCNYIDFYGLRFLLAISESNWYTKGKKRLVPIWFDREARSFFCYKVAVRFGRKSVKS